MYRAFPSRGEEINSTHTFIDKIKPAQKTPHGKPQEDARCGGNTSLDKLATPTQKQRVGQDTPRSQCYLPLSPRVEAIDRLALRLHFEASMRGNGTRRKNATQKCVKHATGVAAAGRAPLQHVAARRQNNRQERHVRAASRWAPRFAVHSRFCLLAFSRLLARCALHVRSLLCFLLAACFACCLLLAPACCLLLACFALLCSLARFCLTLLACSCRGAAGGCATRGPNARCIEQEPREQACSACTHAARKHLCAPLLRLPLANFDDLATMHAQVLHYQQWSNRLSNSHPLSSTNPRAQAETADPQRSSAPPRTSSSFKDEDAISSS